LFRGRQWRCICGSTTAITAGAIAAALALCLRINGISEWIMWEVSDLFENIGTVRDGIGMRWRCPIGVRRQTRRRGRSGCSAGGLEFAQVSFAYTSEPSRVQRSQTCRSPPARKSA
jgi:ATP-binding cassette subfamily B multidrug efflux pump